MLHAAAKLRKDGPRGLGGRVGPLAAGCRPGCGVTFVDTADVCGRSERLIGRFLAERFDAQVVVATTMGRRAPLDPAEYTESAFRAWVGRSRRNLGVDRLDLTPLHCPPEAVFHDDRVLDARERLVADDLVPDATRSQAALRWVIQQPGVTTGSRGVGRCSGSGPMPRPRRRRPWGTRRCGPSARSTTGTSGRWCITVVSRTTWRVLTVSGRASTRVRRCRPARCPPDRLDRASRASAPCTI